MPIKNCHRNLESDPFYGFMMNVFSDHMFQQFSSFTQRYNHSGNTPRYTAKRWIMSGGFIGIFGIPFVVYGVCTNLFLIFILSGFIKRRHKGQLYTICLAIVYLCELIFNLFTLDYLGNGKVWLSNKGFFLDQYGPFSCKMVHYVRQFLTSFEINLVLLESYFCYISIQALGRFTQTQYLTLYTIFSAMGVSLIFAAPTFIVNNIWRLDFRYYCGPDPNWSNPVLRYYCFHRAFLVEGIFQSFLVIVFNILTYLELRQYNSLHFVLEKAVQETQVNEDILKEIINYVRDYCDETRAVLLHTSISAAFSIPRSSFFLNLFTEIYVNSENNTTIIGVLLFYRHCALYNIQYLFYYLFISVFFWIYFFTMQSFRQSVKNVFMKLTCRNVRMKEFFELFTLGDAASDIKTRRGSANLLEQLDDVTLARLQHLENKTETNEEN